MKTLLFNNIPASVIGIGCMRIADLEKSQLDRLVKTALDHGINFFDHADIYGGGKSEALFGELLQKEPSLRSRVILQSKCSIHDGMYDCSKDYILRSADGILERLHTDYLDCLLLHRPDALLEPEEIAAAFDELKRSGKVRGFGVSNMNRYQIELISSALDQKLIVNQLQMSIAHCPAIDAGINVNTMKDEAVMREGGTLEYCRMNGMIVQTWSPLQKGFFGGVFLGDPEYAPLNEVLKELAEKYGCTEDAIAYAWLLRYPARIQVITGTTKPERIINAAQAAEITLSREEWYRIYKASGKTLP
ncbi:MAG: aldo/keto reductase [Solobacterium sp.]|nr:aldo/keto reductase [Solobacterium sp.]